MTICELLENYDPAVRPLGQIPNAERRGPVIVTTSLFVNSISAVSERNMVIILIEYNNKNLVYSFLSNFFEKILVYFVKSKFH